MAARKLNLLPALGHSKAKAHFPASGKTPGKPVSPRSQFHAKLASILVQANLGHSANVLPRLSLSESKG